MEIGRWGYTGISWDFGPGGTPRPRQLEKPQEGQEIANPGGVRGKDQVPNFPKGKLRLVP